MAKVTITGGAGFIGSNLAQRLLREGHEVTIFDNLSRAGCESNLAWLREQFGADSFRLIAANLTDFEALRQAMDGAERIYHLAGQVAVTTSVKNPRADFEDNALGTFNALEAARQVGNDPIFLYSSTNKVYGGMEEIRIVEGDERYAYADFPAGIPETTPLDFHSPYGCCYSADTDILTREGWKRFYELAPDDEVLTYNLDRQVAEFQQPTDHFAFPYQGKMYVQRNRRLRTCVTPNHKMLVAWDRTPCNLIHPRLQEAQEIAGKPMAYLLAADVEGGEEVSQFVLPETKAGKHKHRFPARSIPMQDWLHFLGWYLSEGHCYENKKTGHCIVVLTTYYRTEEALNTMRAVGLSPVVDKHHVVATSRHMYEYVKVFGKSHDKFIPAEIKALHPKHLKVLLKSLIAGDGNRNGKNGWRYTSVSKRLADDVQEIAIRCGMAARVIKDNEGFYRVYMSGTRTAQCNLGKDRSEWVDYDGMVYCVEVPNSVVMVRQSGAAYFSGNSKGAGDQYTRDYYRIYGVRSVVMRQSCLAATQEVITPFGKKAIAEVREGDLVHSGRGWVRVRRVWQTGEKFVRRLTTMNGLDVTLTADHRVFRPHGLFSNRDFAYGDFLAVLPEAKHLPAWEAIPDRVLDAERYMAAVRAHTQDARCLNEASQLAERLLPLRGDRLLALTEIVGWLFGDGHLGVHHRQGREAPAHTIQYFGSQAELTEIRERLAWLGIPSSAIIRSEAVSELPSGHVIAGETRRIQQQSIPLFTLFELLGVPVGDKVRVAYNLPDWVATGHPLVKRAFLRGFFGAELGRVCAGTQVAPSFAQSKDVAFLADGRAWMEQLRALLAEFDIATSYGEAEAVGNTIRMTVQVLEEGLYPKLASIGYAFNAERAQHLNALLRWQWSHAPTEQFDTIQKLYAADGMLFWDSLATVEEMDEAVPVYDLEVEDERHLFLAGGIQVSNCIYGPRQLGVEDQGWVAWFIIAALKGRPITIFGNGKQVRDVLYIDDLLDGYEAAVRQIDRAAGQIYNIGGGPANTMSIWREFGPMLEGLLGRPIPVTFSDWRPGDQPVYISNIEKIKQELGWAPAVGVREGITRLHEWVRSNQNLFDHL